MHLNSRTRVLAATLTLSVVLPGAILVPRAAAHAIGAAELVHTAASSTPMPIDITDESPKPGPVLVIRSYRTSSERILVGSRFKLTLEIHNATSRKAHSVVVSVNGPSSPVGEAAGSPVGGLAVIGTGNAKYVGTIPGGTRTEVAFDMMVAPATSPGAYAVPVSVSYEYAGGRQDTAYTVGLVVERDASFSVIAAQIPDTAVAGETFDASFEVANTSGFALNGVTLSVEATGADVADGTAFIGAFDSASSEPIDVSVTPTKAGRLELALVVTYRDDFGRARVFRQPYTVTVEAEPAPGTPVDSASDKSEEAKHVGGFLGFLLALLGLGS